MPASQLQAKANFQWIDLLPSDFHPTAVQFHMAATVFVKDTGAAQFVACSQPTVVPWLVHNSSRSWSHRKGWLVQAVLWWLLPWEPKQERAVAKACSQLMPSGCLAWQDSIIAAHGIRVHSSPPSPTAGYLNLILNCQISTCMSLTGGDSLWNPSRFLK